MISICRYITGFDMVDWVNLGWSDSGCVSAGPWGECCCINEREVAVLAFKAVTR